MAVRRPNLVFEEAIDGACGFELIEAPFEKDFADVAELALFTSGEFFKVGAQSLTDPQADLCFPFAHHLTRLLAVALHSLSPHNREF
jgi:hypothetical protein